MNVVKGDIHKGLEFNSFEDGVAFEAYIKQYVHARDSIKQGIDQDGRVSLSGYFINERSVLLRILKEILGKTKEVDVEVVRANNQEVAG